MLKFEIFFDMNKNPQNLKFLINYFYLKYIKCMLDTPNNHFWDISKIEIPKIRPFYNLMGAKITKKRVKVFSA